MSQKEKVVVAMSGGVDSSVAAALLQREGYEVIGMTMDLFSLPEDFCLDENLKSCCGLKAKEDAVRVAVSLGIDHFVVNMKEEFENRVIGDFIDEYTRGRTPNPCIRCNEFIKFDYLLERAAHLGAKYLATGHHARIDFNHKTQEYLLQKGRDSHKDQTYFLYTMNQDQLSRTLFPIGGQEKKTVRKIARDLDLPIADRPESQEICFIPDDDYIRFLKERIPDRFRPGPIIDEAGKKLGEHMGILHYTIGQRRGLGISAANPLYVLKIDTESNTIIVGEGERLFKQELLASHVRWNSPPVKGESMDFKACIRYRHTEAPARLTWIDSDLVRIRFTEPQRAITPGQSVVFYEKDRVLGGGIIETVVD
ncbi:tRNA 2-thiouridine(34) synthase MnmA [Acidobacteriota bacterium]